MSVEGIVAIGVAFAVTFVVLLAVVLFALLLSAGKEHPMKRARYEAGNPPKGEARTWLPMQYFGYLIIFLSLEPILILLFLFPEYVRATGDTVRPLLLTLIILLIAVPPLVFGLKQADRVEFWKLTE